MWKELWTYNVKLEKFKSVFLLSLAVLIAQKALTISFAQARQHKCILRMPKL